MTVGRLFSRLANAGLRPLLPAKDKKGKELCSAPLRAGKTEEFFYYMKKKAYLCTAKGNQAPRLQ